MVFMVNILATLGLLAAVIISIYINLGCLEGATIIYGLVIIILSVVGYKATRKKDKAFLWFASMFLLAYSLISVLTIGIYILPVSLLFTVCAVLLSIKGEKL